MKSQLASSALVILLALLGCSGKGGSAATNATASEGGEPAIGGSRGTTGGSSGNTGTTDSGGTVGQGGISSGQGGSTSAVIGTNAGASLGGAGGSGGAIVKSGGAGGGAGLSGKSTGTAGTNPSTGGAFAVGGTNNRGGSAGTTVPAGAGVGGQSGSNTGGANIAGSGATATLVNNYDGARESTVSFDLGWKFHLGDVSGAQTVSFDDAAYDDAWAGWGASAEASWKDVNTRAWIAGEFIWTGFDYIGEPTPYTWPSKSSYFGAIDTAYFPKDAFYFYQSKWNANGPPMVHIVPMNWTNWTNGQSVKVMVYTNAESVELFLNGKSQGSKTMSATTGHLQWSVPFATGTLEAKASKGGAVVVSDKVQTAGAAAALTLKADRNAITANGRDLSFVEVDVVDAQGVVVPQANNSISFTISGPGTLVGLDAGDSTNHESYKGNSHAAFSGKLMAIVQSTTTSGAITVKASSGSLTGSSVVITTATP